MLWANILLHLSAIGCIALLAWMVGWKRGYRLAHTNAEKAVSEAFCRGATSAAESD